MKSLTNQQEEMTCRHERNKNMFNRLFEGRHILKIILFLVLGIISVNLRAGDSTDIVWLKYTHEISRLQFSNDDSKILTVGSGGTIIFDTKTGVELKRMDGIGVYDYDGKFIYFPTTFKDSSGNDVFKINILDANTYDVIRNLNINELKGNYPVNISRDNTKLIAVRGGNMYLIDFQNGKLISHLTTTELNKPNADIGAFLFTNNDKILILSLYDPIKGNFSNIVFYNLETQSIIHEISGKNYRITLSDDGTMLAYSDISQTGKAVTVMNTQTHEIIGQIPGKPEWVRSIAFSPDGKYIGVGGNVDSYGLNIYYTTDFSIFKTLLPNTSFSNFDISQTNEEIVLGVSNQLALIKIIQADILEVLQQSEFIYPNPTDQTLTITFNLAEQGNLNFNLYDLTGQKISNLQSGFYGSGTITEQLSLKGIPVGTYFLKIESLHFTKTYKLIVGR